MNSNMKKLIVLILMAALLPLTVLAQSGLHSDAIFKGQVVPQSAMVEVKVKGRTLSRYRLTFYHSVRFNATAQQKASINNLVERDAKQAVSTETRKQGGRRSLILSLPPYGQTHRYLCYVSGGHGDKNAITLVYMEGKVASIDELRKLIQ